MHENRPIWDQGQGFLSIEARSPLAWGVHFLFPWKSEGSVSLAVLKHSCLAGAEPSRPAQSRADGHRTEQTRAQWSTQCSTEQTREEQSCLVGEGPGTRATWPLGCLLALLFSQLGCITIELFYTK